jgi:hypothetical protein
MKRTVLLAGAIALAMTTASGAIAAADRTQTPAPAEKVVHAVRTNEPITLDGRLDESVWKTAPRATGFTQNDPQDGAPPTEQTDVWVAYDDHALYVAAFCHDSDPSKIRKRLGRRDSQTDSDWFAVAVDPYFDKRSGYLFVANPAGSITDMVLSNDVNEDGRAAHPVQPDPVPQKGRKRLGRQLPAHAPAQEREIELQLGP